MDKKGLEERIQRLEKNIQHLLDIHKIQNLMGRYEYLHTAGMNVELVDGCFALRTPGVRVELPTWGIYEGPEGVKKAYAGIFDHLYHMHAEEMKKLYPGVEFKKERAGAMVQHSLTTPVIEVAGDGKTAKGVWISPGHETMALEGKLTAHWAWAKYGIDFIKEDGTWKIWHLHVYPIFYTPYEKSWADVEENKEMPDFLKTFPDHLKATRPCTYEAAYNRKYVPEYIPAPPEPYETFDETTAY
jgi:hypothetical protein